jgi:hypothetical protein
MLAPLRLRALLWISVALITHGSLYPWRFVAPASWPAALHDLFGGGMWTGLSDVVGNIVLFVPLGVLGTLLLRERRDALMRRLALSGFVIVGVAFSFGLQVLQICIPSRTAVVSDSVWNTAGLILGIVLASLGTRVTPLLPNAGAGPRPALALAGLWLALEWWPFVPTIDWQHVKDALKPLLLEPKLSLRSVAEVSVSVVVLGYALRSLPRPALWTAATVAAAAVGKLVIVDASLSISHVIGFGIGLVLAALLAVRRETVATQLTALLALAWFTIDALHPYSLMADPHRFHALPFAAMLEGSMESNALALLWNLFWIGAIMVPASTLGGRPGTFAVGLSLWVLLLELLQRWLPQRTADITPTLLPWLWVLLWPGEAHLLGSNRRADAPRAHREPAARSGAPARHRQTDTG